jgi:hypothetical protein
LSLLLLVSLPVLAEEDLYIEAELSPPDPYIQAPVEYSIRLYRALTLSQGSLILPEQEYLVIEPLAESTVRNVERGGRLYQVQELRYLLFPQRSGRLVIEAPVFSGRHVFGRGPELELEVRPRPVTTDAPWIPAHGLSLSEAWRTPEPPWQVGDLLERVITIEARGVTGAQLPKLAAPGLPGMEIQELGADVGQQLVDGQLIGRRVQRQRLLASEAGRYELPELRLSWWSLDEDGPQEAQLPGRTLEFVPSATLPPQAGGATVGLAEAVVEPRVTIPIVWILVLSGTLLAVVLGVLAYRHYLSPAGQHRRRAAFLLRQVDIACRNNDASSAAKGLQEWALHGLGGREAWTLGRLAGQFDGEISESLWRLDAQLYCHTGSGWDGLQFAATVLPVLRGRHKVSAKRPAMVLPPLNP